MALVKLNNQTELAFIVWIDNFPESFHFCDMQRFYVFIKTFLRHGSKKWYVYDYFRARILERKPNFDVEDIDRLFEIMDTCIQFHNSLSLGSYEIGAGNTKGLMQKGVKNGEIYIGVLQDDLKYGG